MPFPREIHESIADAFEDELKKIKLAQLAQAASRATGVLSKKNLGIAVGGAVGYETLRRAEHDRRTGRAMRIQQGY